MIDQINSSFAPPALLRNAHVQSLLASAGPRTLIAKKHARVLLAQSKHCLIDAGNDVTLSGYYTRSTSNTNPLNSATNKLAILIHGWLGGDQSSYLMSAAAYLHDRGFSVFRLNLRDHGETHHLNPELFHSVRIQEVLDAIAEIQRLYPHDSHYLAGFSLGGNFALRVAAMHDSQTTQFEKIAAVCPVIDPWHSMQRIEDAAWFYEWYFVQKWKKSIKAKLDHFPGLSGKEALSTARSLSDLNNYFVPAHTTFDSAKEYFNAYAVTGDALLNLAVPTHIIHSVDDPIIDVNDLQKTASSDMLSIELTQYGGHCGFLEDFKLQSWTDRRLHQLFNETSL